MYLKGYNSNGDAVKDANNQDKKIAIESFGYDPNNVNTGLDFVNVEALNGGTKVKVDRTAQSYPSPQRGFYIKIKDPNGSTTVGDSSSTTTTTTTTTNWTSSVKLVIETETVDIKTESKAILYNSFVYTAKSNEIGHGTDHHFCGHYGKCSGHDGVWDYEKDEWEKEPWYHEGDCPYNPLTCEHDKCKCEWKRYKITVSTEQRQSFMEVEETMEVNIKKEKTEITKTTSGSSSSSETTTTGGDAIEYNFHISMSIGGKVWEDMPSGKESLANGIYDVGHDRVIPNVKVSLYEADTGKLATLDPSATQRKKATTLPMIMCQMNPTYTDDFGEYLFTGVNPLKKYYVKFEYDGQIYMPTDYKMNLGEYNTVNWKVTSKGTEKTSDRDNYDKRFEEIGSSPVNYKSTNSLKTGQLVRGKNNEYYNETFSDYELMGYKLNYNGNYVKNSERLIDSFYTLQDGKIVETDIMQEGRISKEIKQFVLANKKAPTQSDLINIYNKIANGNKELLRKLQFIEDCKIEAYTQNQGANTYDLYPIQDEFYLGKLSYENWDSRVETVGKITAQRRYSKVMEKEVKEGYLLQAYPGQLQINLGLWRRQEVDIALKKDLLYAATRINGKTEVYEYNKRVQYTEAEKAELKRLRQIYEKDGRQPGDYQNYLDYKAKIENKDTGYWQISARMKDYNYNNYYGDYTNTSSTKSGDYLKEIYPSDYNYRSLLTNNPYDTNREQELQLYITYKITIRNVSQSILNKVTEVVDYYDKDYTYRDDLSWVMYKTNSDKNSAEDLREINFTEADYYDTIHNLKLSGNIADKNRGTNASDNSQYADKNNEKYRSTECISDMTSNYQDVYIKGLKDKYLASGEEAYIYLTFQVNKNGDNPITLDNKDDPNDVKYNYAEINGVQTYYKDGTKLPNNQTKGHNDAAGLIDINSTPGNLCKDDLKPTNGRYEQNFENDTDRSKGIKVLLENSFIRSISGTVWEDERTKKVGDSIIGNGQFDKDENTIRGATVELVEKLQDPSGKEYEYVWQKTTTDANGKYEFKTDKDNKTYIIPGNYIVRFHYGDTEETVLINSNNKTSYNGQDFKTTIYQMQDGDKELEKYKGTIIDKKTGAKVLTTTTEENRQDEEKYYTEYYDIKQLDDLSKSGVNLSDAKDLWIKETHTVRRRQEGNNTKSESYQGRTDVINYSNNNGNGVTNNIAEILASPYESPSNDKRIQDLIAGTQMTAETGLIILEGEYDRTGTDGYTNVNNNYGTNSEFYKNENSNNGKYALENVDCGLTERPKAQLELNKKITNVKITLANGNIIFDAANGVSQQDLTWQSGTAYELDVNAKIESNRKYNEYYKNYDRYYYRDTVKGIVEDKYRTGTNGFINVIMDEEIMHGATIRISYDLTVTNVGEVDYAEFGTNNEKDAVFYYKGTEDSAKKAVTTSADVVLDYVANNLQFREVDNNVNGWKAVHDIASETGINSIKNAEFNKHVKQYNTLITTPNLGDKLTPTVCKEGTHSKTIDLILTQLITPENTADDKTYTNIAEITTISNDVGRRMAYSIQGNQDPTKDPEEVDSFRAERITILPPFGIGDIIVYTAVALGALSILAVGIIFIKKKVIKK